jgi:hypothetical protein
MVIMMNAFITESLNACGVYGAILALATAITGCIMGVVDMTFGNVLLLVNVWACMFSISDGRLPKAIYYSAQLQCSCSS